MVIEEVENIVNESTIVKREIDHTIELADNAMLKHRPDLFDEWDFEKNDELGLDVYTISIRSNKKANWQCSKCNSIFKRNIDRMQRSEGCPYCNGTKVNITNCLSTVRPDLLSEWNYKINTLSPENVTSNSSKRVWWVCGKCNSDYYIKVSSKASGKGCTFCVGKTVNHTNSLASLYPELVKQWHPYKNGDLTPDMVTCKSAKKIWWVGNCNHEWETNIHHRTNGNGCPYCANSNTKTLKGFNDLNTTDYNLTLRLLNPEDGYKYMRGSHKKVDWKCLECGNVLKSKVIADVVNRGLFCHVCSDGVSYPEKFMIGLLKQFNIDFEYNYNFGKSSDRYYDFFLPKFNMVIETHGGQHYNGSFSRMGGRGLEEEQLNDMRKKKYAADVGITNYFEIDCRESNKDYIKGSIINSNMLECLKLEDVDWDYCNEHGFKSFVKITANLWNEGIRSATEIGKIINVSRPTARKYLRQAADLNWCNYDAKEALTERSIKNGISRRKKVIQLSKSGEYIKEWQYAQEASDELKIGRPGITSVCNGKKKTAYGFRWMYKVDYDKIKENDIIVHG